MQLKSLLLSLILALTVISCSPINKKTLGVNAFVNDPSFGTISQQFQEVQQTLGINYVRVLFNWNDQIQPTPTSTQNFSFYDSILQDLPAGMDALVIVNGIPSWMSDSSNWIDGDPRKTFVELWFKPVLSRYASNTKIAAWEVWNEPNDDGNPQNVTLAINESSTNGAQNFTALLSDAFSVSRSLTPNVKVVAAATTSINQNYPITLNYGKTMKTTGAQNYCDIWGVHYYGTEYDHIILPGGIAEFLNSLTVPIWITESGAKGVNNQLNYVNKTWSILDDTIKNIQRTYYYQFTEATPPDTTYGLRNLGPGQEYSDLYNYLKSH
jgi:Cellulase (glycosyl hydrolase family 5)